MEWGFVYCGTRYNFTFTKKIKKNILQTFLNVYGFQEILYHHHTIVLSVRNSGIAIVKYLRGNPINSLANTEYIFYLEVSFEWRIENIILHNICEVYKDFGKLINIKQLFFYNADLLGHYIYEKHYIDDSTTDNTTGFMKIYA